MNLFRPINGVVCRACGATHAAPAPSGFKHLCVTCWKRFSASVGYIKQPSEDMLNRWLARQLFLNVRRLRIYGVAGRCEAISMHSGDSAILGYKSDGPYQCATPATLMRDGRRVCTSHGRRADDVMYVGDPTVDPYTEFSHALADLALEDEQFSACLKEAVEYVDAQQNGTMTAQAENTSVNPS